MEDQPIRPERLRDIVLTVACIGIILALLRLSAAIVEPLLLALFIVAIANNPVNWMRKHGVSNAVAVTIAFLGILLALGGVTAGLSRSLSGFAADLPVYQEKLGAIVAHLEGWLARRGIDAPEGGIFNAGDPEKLVSIVESVAVNLGLGLSNALLVVFLALFLLAETAILPRKMAAVGKHGRVTLQRLLHIVNDVNRYMGAKALVSFATGLLIWIALRVLGLSHAELWGVLAFILNFVPTIGSIVAAVPAVLVALIELEPAGVVAVVIVFLAVNMVIGNLVEPLVMGRRLGLSTVVVFLSLVFWGWMFGTVGMLLSVPLSMAVKAFVEEHPHTRWIAVLMGPSPEGVDAEVIEGPESAASLDPPVGAPGEPAGRDA